MASGAMGVFVSSNMDGGCPLRERNVALCPLRKFTGAVSLVSQFLGIITANAAISLVSKSTRIPDDVSCLDAYLSPHDYSGIPSKLLPRQKVE